jgi:DMSO/TMAO reductase YedYZ heme-binding membrane subunit
MNANMLWFTARGAGLSAMLVLSLAVSFGAFGSQRIKSVSTRVVVQYLHRTAAMLGLLLILVHVSTLILDSKSNITLAGALVPFAARYRPNSVALGSIAMYAFVFVAAIGSARGRMASSRRGAASWRALHALSYPVWAIAVAHGLLAGTDRSQHWVVLLTILCVASVLIAASTRFGSQLDPPAVPTPRAPNRAVR